MCSLAAIQVWERFVTASPYTLYGFPIGNEWRKLLMTITRPSNT